MVKFARKSPIQEYCKRFGQIAVERGYVTVDQLKEALLEQVDDDLANKPHRYLGTICFEKNWITWNQVEAILDEMFGLTKVETHSISVSPPKKRK